MNKLDMFQEIFGKLDELAWFNMERIKTNTVAQFTSMEFLEDPLVCRVRLTLASPDHHEMNGQLEVTWKNIANYLTLNYGAHTGFW